MDEENSQPQTQKQQNEKLLRLMSGYDQHASLNFPNTTPHSATLRPKILNVLIDMKKNNKSDYTINFTRKALSYLGKHTSLEEPEAVKLLIAELKASDGYKRARSLCRPEEPLEQRIFPYMKSYFFQA